MSAERVPRARSRFVLALLALGTLAVLVVLGAGAGASWLFHTEAGLRWLSTRLVGFAGEGLTLEGVAGTLAGGARVAVIRYAGEDIEVRAQDATLALSPLSVLRLRPRLTGVAAREIAVVTKPGEPRGKPPETLELPLDFELADAQVERLVVDLGKDPLDLANVRLSYFGGRTRHTVRTLALHAFGHAVALRGTIDAQAPFAIDAALTAVRPQNPPGVAFARIGGNLTEMAIEGGARSGDARATLAAAVRPYDDVPLAGAKATTSGLDLAALADALPHTALSGEIALEREGGLLTGPVRIENAAPGPYDRNRLPLAALRGTVSTDLEVVTFKAVRADLGAAGSVAGSGTVEGDTAVLSLSTRNLDLRGLHSRLRETQLAGRAEFKLAPTRQHVTAELREGDIALALAAEKRGEEIDVPRFRAEARGGAATGKAHAMLTGAQPFRTDAELRRFDPAAWGDFPRGSINATVSARGTLAGPSADLRFAIRGSRWLGAPLAGEGRLAIAERRVREANVELALGGNRLTAHGALGAPNDTLVMRVDAPRLGALDAALRGNLRGTARLSGALESLRAQFDLSGSGLAYEGLGSVKRLDLKGTIGLRPEDRFDVQAAARGIVTPHYDLATLSASLEGTRAAHAASVSATGKRVDFAAQARGAWKAGSAWRGTVLELANRGEVPLALTAPVSLTVAPQRVRVEPFEMRVIDGRLTVSELAYERGRLSTAGRMTNLAVRPLAALAGAPAEIAGTLRLSGSWKLAQAPQLVGTITIVRESGELALGAPGRRVELGLRELALNADLGPHGATFKARLRSALADAAGEGELRLVGSGAQARYGAASPIEMTAAVDVARLAPFAALIDTAMIVGGEAHARVKVSGTLAEPRITGPLTADRLAMVLPAEGINFMDGTLRARFDDRVVRVDSFSIRGGDGVMTAQGVLARNGFDEASLDWRAERFTALSRPDRRLVVSGKGNAALKGGKLSLTGEVRADDGLFELGGTSLPTLSDDVVIVGRTPKPPPTGEPGPLKAFALDIRIDLGRQVHVRGEGLDARLAGDMRIFTSPQGEIRASGTVSARDGTFVAYGRRLEIDRGRLYFNGPIANPALDIVAMRKRQAVEAGVAVSGTLKNPLVRVVSDPPLPQGEALSWLLLGRGPDEASAGELSALPLAADALIGKATGGLATRLNLEELGFRRGDELGQGFVTLGKRISDRLYVVFEQGLGAAESLLRLEYTLTRRIVVRAEAGEANSLGVYYRRRWD